MPSSARGFGSFSRRAARSRSWPRRGTATRHCAPSERTSPTWPPPPSPRPSRRGPAVRGVLQAGANGYVLKTADAEDIVEAVRSVREGKSVLDPAIARQVMRRFSGEGPLPLEALTERELEVLRLAAHGYTNKAIGVQLSISDRTVQGHLAKIFGKLHAASRTEAVMRAVSQGIIPPVLETNDDS